MVGRGLGGTGAVSGTGTVVVPCGRYCGGARWVVIMSFGIPVSRWYPFWFLRQRHGVLHLILSSILLGTIRIVPSFGSGPCGPSSVGSVALGWTSVTHEVLGLLVLPVFLGCRL